MYSSLFLLLLIQDYMSFEKNYIIDNKGKKIAVQIPIETYQKLVEDSEELEDIKTYRKAKLQKSDPVPFDVAFNEIEKSKK